MDRDFNNLGHNLIFIVQFDREEMAIDEAELEPREFAEKLQAQQKLQEQVKQHRC